jgi:hypothetical protein
MRKRVSRGEIFRGKFYPNISKALQITESTLEGNLSLKEGLLFPY